MRDMACRAELSAFPIGFDRARRAAKCVGLIARKSRWLRDSIDNFGDYMLIDLYGNYPVAGFRFDMTAEDVIAYCKGDQ